MEFLLDLFQIEHAALRGMVGIDNVVAESVNLRFDEEKGLELYSRTTTSGGYDGSTPMLIF